MSNELPEVTVILRVRAGTLTQKRLVPKLGSLSRVRIRGKVRLAVSNPSDACVRHPSIILVLIVIYQAFPIQRANHL